MSQSRPEDGDYRQSYVLFNECVPLRLVIEIVSKNGKEKRDTTPGTGKFWVYENVIRAECYAIFDLRSEDAAWKCSSGSGVIQWDGA